MTSSPTRRAPVIAVNATAYDGEPSGTRNRAVGLSAALLRAGADLDVFCSSTFDFAALIDRETGSARATGRLRVEPVDVDPKQPIRRALTGSGSVRRRLDARRHDMFLTDYFPVPVDVPTVLSIHDLRYLAGEARGFSSRGRELWFKGFYPRIARRASLVVVLTDARGDETARLLGMPREKIVTVPMAVSRAFREAKQVVHPGRHLLGVGMGDERKGADVLARAQANAVKAGAVLPIILTGRRTPHITRILDAHEDLVVAGHLKHVGLVDDAELIDLYRQAAALLHPSRYEGFGVPVLEALTLGVPVIAAEDPAVREVAGAAATYIDAEDFQVWSQALRRIADLAPMMPRPDLTAVERAARSGWDQVAETFLSAVDAAVGGHH